MRAASAVLCTCVLLIFGAYVESAHAGGYRDYGDGYAPRYRGGGEGYYPRYNRGNVWYSSKCCYKKIVRHVREVRYVRTEPYRRYGYEGSYRPWREGYSGGYDRRPWRRGYYGRPVSYTDVYVGPARRYEGYPPGYGNVGYNGGYSGGYNGGYDSYNSADVVVAPACVQRRVPVGDGRGGWVWAVRRACD